MFGSLKELVVRLTSCCFKHDDDAFLSRTGTAVAQSETNLVQEGYVGVFWDIENCAIPNGCNTTDLVRRLEDTIQSYGEIIRFTAYGKQELLGSRASELQACGVEFIQVPSGKEMSDKAMILDAMCFAFDNKAGVEETQMSQRGQHTLPDSSICWSLPLPCVVLITADSGFAPLVSRLLARNIRAAVITRIVRPVTYIVPPHPVSLTLLKSGADIHDWNDVISNPREPVSPSVSSSSGTLVTSPVATTGDEDERAAGWVERRAADFGEVSSCAIAGPAVPEFSLTRVPEHALPGVTEDETSLGRLKYQMMTVLAARGKLTLESFHQAFTQIMGKPIRLADYGLARMKEIGDVLPDVVQLNSAWAEYENSELLPAAERNILSRQQTLHLVPSPQNWRTLGLIQSRLRLVVQEALASIVVVKGVGAFISDGATPDRWLSLSVLQKDLEDRTGHPVGVLLSKHGYKRSGRKSQIPKRFSAMLQEMPDVVQMLVDELGQVYVRPVGGPKDRLITDWVLDNPMWDGVQSGCSRE